MVNDMKNDDNAKLRASITREYMKVKHSILWRSLKPSQKEADEIDKIVNATIEAAGIGTNLQGKKVDNFFDNMVPEIQKKLAHEMVIGFLANKKLNKVNSSIAPNSLTTGRQVIEFDGVFKELKSKFAIRSDDYKKLFEQYNKIHDEIAKKLADEATKGRIHGGGAEVGSSVLSENLDKTLRTNTVNLIDAFSKAQGGKNKVDRSVLFSKEFTEAIKLNHNNPEIGVDLLTALKREKPFNPKELCKAFSACMEGVEAIRKSTHPELGKSQQAKFNKDVNAFLEVAVHAIKDAKHVDKKLLADVKGMTKVAEENAEAKIEFAKKWQSQADEKAQVAGRH